MVPHGVCIDTGIVCTFYHVFFLGQCLLMLTSADGGRGFDLSSATCRPLSGKQLVQKNGIVAPSLLSPIRSGIPIRGSAMTFFTGNITANLVPSATINEHSHSVRDALMVS